MTATLEIDTVETPQDEAPPTTNTQGDFNPEYPGSTEDAPYGFKDDGTPYRRRPKGTAKRTAGPSRMPASESLARSAAGLLSTVNNLTAIALMAGNLPLTAEAIQTANTQFEQMAYEALLTDPALCRKILSAGATGGKAGLIMAYGMLTMSIFPAAKMEIQSRRIENNDHDNES